MRKHTEKFYFKNLNKRKRKELIMHVSIKLLSKNILTFRERKKQIQILLLNYFSGKENLILFV